MARLVFSKGSVSVVNVPKGLRHLDSRRFNRARRIVDAGTIVHEHERLGGERRRIELTCSNGAKRHDWVSGPYWTMVMETYQKLAALENMPRVQSGGGVSAITNFLAPATA